ncbi:hypothetical protein LJC46_08255 [Desulfovibrio sp. OttesenSCG-928-G15]|nr:hypothetical protein [Desulfovibrio sp. OttesenSCG-928-G15]
MDLSSFDSQDFPYLTVTSGGVSFHPSRDDVDRRLASAQEWKPPIRVHVYIREADNDALRAENAKLNRKITDLKAQLSDAERHYCNVGYSNCLEETREQDERMKAENARLREAAAQDQKAIEDVLAEFCGPESTAGVDTIETLPECLWRQLAHLKAVNAAQGELVEALEWEMECGKFRGTFVGKMHGPAYQAMCASSVHAIGVAHEARKNLAALEEQCPEQS